MWKVPDNYDALKQDALKFAHSEAKDALQSTIAIANNVRNRSYTLLAAAFAFLGYTATYLDMGQFDAEQIVLCCGTVAAIAAIVILVTKAAPNKIMHPGAEPKELITPEYSRLEEKQLDYMLLNRLECLQEQVAYNDKVNGRGVGAIAIAIWIMAGSILLYIISYLLR